LKIALLPENNEGFLDKLRKMATSKKILDNSGIKPSAI